jgi:hypothetical protein
LLLYLLDILLCVFLAVKTEKQQKQKQSSIILFI